MTLNSKFIISNPLALPMEVFNYCQEIVGTINPFWEHEKHPKYDWQINPRLHNYSGQGFNAIIDVEYGADGPLMVRDENTEEIIEHKPFGYILISFDTVYGYSGINGENCDQLHTNYIIKLGKWCEENGWQYHWQNEYTGKWFGDYRLANNFGGR